MKLGFWHGRPLSEVPAVQIEMYCAQVDPLDDRGLMPVDEARKVLAGLTVYEHRAERVAANGFVVRDTDVWWAALLSLQDAEEFVATATTLEWRDHVRGRDNVSVFERYGDGIMPWLRSRLNSDGVLNNTPWCVLPSLLASSSAEAFELAASVRRIVEMGDSTQPWRVETSDPAETVTKWLSRHPEPGFSYIAAGGEVAGLALRSMFNADPRGAQRRLRAVVGKNEADRLLAAHSLRVPPVLAAVQGALRSAPDVEVWASSTPLTMADLDLLLEDFQGPAWDNPNKFTSAMRLTGFCAPNGSDGLIVQCLTVDRADRSVEISFHAVGFGEPAGEVQQAAVVLVPGDQLCESRAGSVDVKLLTGRIIQVDLSVAGGDNPAEMVARLLGSERNSRNTVFLDPKQLVVHLGLPEPLIALVELDEWQHPASGESPAASPDLQLVMEAMRQRREINESVTGATWSQYPTHR